MADSIPYNEQLKNFLKESINQTKSDKSEFCITLARNSITILVAAQISFSNEDLSNISIPGANLRNSIFHLANLSGSDLSNTNLSNSNLVECNLSRANLEGIDLSIYPDLEINENIHKIIFSVNVYP
jgi:uncharacterized protein YjbI with pentapeptide repeats